MTIGYAASRVVRGGDEEVVEQMRLVGAKIGLALMFEGLVKQGVVKKHSARTGKIIELD